MDRIIDYVFIDTSVLMQESYFKSTSRIAQLFDLASKGYLKILLPIITKQEWIKHIKECTYFKFDDVKRKLQLLGNLPNVSKFVDDFEKITSTYANIVVDSVDTQISNGRVEVIDYSFFSDTLPDVFDKYFKKTKPFGSNGKSKEFPDAFVLAALEKYAIKHSIDQIVIFSSDKDIKQYVSDKLEVREIGAYLDDFLKNKLPSTNKEKQIKDIDKLFSYIQSVSPIFREDLEARITDFLSDENVYNERFYYVDIDDVSDINIKLDISAKDMEIISITDDEITAVCFPEIDGTVKVSHFSEEDSIWDSEDKCYFHEVYIKSTIELSSYVKVYVTLHRDSLDMGQEPHIEIKDVDFSSLQDSIDDDRRDY